jgi:NitT/TauT family transport system ATP-binding protein
MESKRENKVLTTETGASASATPSQRAPVIEIGGLSKTYRTKAGPVEALRAVDLQVRECEFVALVGPSGCGKSTLLHIVAGLVEHEVGTVDVAGTPAKAGRKDTGIMLQKPVLFPWRTVLDNVLLPVEILKLDRDKAKVRARELLETVGLGGFEDKYPWELSGGMRQRASLVQALVSDPKLLLMDEPFSAVDEFTRERLNCEVANLHETLGRTTLYVTHNILEAVFLADRVVAMKPRPGEVVEVIDIDLPRPRTLDLLDDERTQAYVAQVRRALHDNSKEA